MKDITMPRITVIQKGKSLVNVALEGRNLALPNNSRRDATCTVEDGIVTGPADLLEKIKDGTITVVNWHGHRIDGEVAGNSEEQAEEDAEESTTEQPPVKVTPPPVAKETKAKPPVKVTPPANAGNLLQQPNEVTE